MRSGAIVLFAAIGLLPAPTQAQVTMDVTKMTCRQFLIGKIVPTKSVALWLSGYYHAKRDVTTVDLESFEPNADKVRTYCGLHQNETVMNAVEATFGVK